MKTNYSFFRTRTVIMTLLIFVAIALILYSGEQKTPSFRQHPEMKPNDWMAMQRLYPYGKVNPEAWLSAVDQTQERMTDATAGPTEPWVFKGPTNIGGRITDIEQPLNDMQTIYVGAATGGIFKTTDFGNTWTNLFEDLPVVSVGDIAIDPNNPLIIYAGMGEANSSSFSFLGNGIYKSMDAGETWQHMGLEQSAYIGRVIVDYSNSQRVFVAACGNLFSATDQRGVYRSNNGGSTWEQVLFLTDSTAAADLVQHPSDPQIIYATMWERARGLTYRRSFGESSGIWKSSDGGTTWSELTSGLPTGDVGRIGITISKSNPEILYAFYDLPDYEVAIFKTQNGGQNWTRLNDGDLWGMSSNFGWYFGQIRVDPQEPNRVFVMGVPMYRTENGGTSWEDVSWDLHVDHHAMFFDETNDRIIQGNDGGLYFSTNNGSSWTKMNNLPITQFYAIDIDHTYPYRLYGGTQDNNTIRTLTGNEDDWEPILGGDGMYTLVDYENPDIIYAEYQYGNLHRSDDGGYNMNYIADAMSGDRVNWSAPLIMHPQDPKILYFGTYRVWKTTNRGNSWTDVSEDLTWGGDNYFHTLSTLAISQVNPAIVLAGSSDGKVHVSDNNGLTWTDISAGLPNRWITRVATDPFDAQTIYVTLSGFRWDEPLPHVFKSTDLGQNWNDISGNLPEFPVNDIVLDPDVPDRIIVGTDAGVYGSIDGGQYWYWLWTGNPAVPVCAMKIHTPTRKIVAGTYGLSMYSANLDELFTGIREENKQTRLHMTVFPNPVKDHSVIRFYLPEEDHITLSMVNQQGQEIGKVFSGRCRKGEQQIPLHSALFRSSVEGISHIVLRGERNIGSSQVLFLK